MSRFGKFSGVFSVFVMLVMAMPAEAAFQIRFYQDLGSDPTIATPFLKEVIDNDLLSGDIDPTVGSIIIVPNYTVGAFQVFLTTSLTNSPGSASVAHLEIGHTTISNTSAALHTLYAFVTSTDYTTPGFIEEMDVVFTASGSLNTGSTSTGYYKGYVDAPNALFGMGTAAPTINFSLPNGGGNRSFAATTKTLFTDTPPLGYSMSILGKFAVSAGGSYSGTTGNLDTTPIPAPGALALALAGLPFLGLGWLRRRAK